jgi:hypothetical protein
MTTSAEDAFEAWLRTPVSLGPPHPRFELLRAKPQDFPRIYDLIDEGFGEVRPRARYDWLYRKNPAGPARCWIAVETASGRLAGAISEWPWPLARASEAREGHLSGDSVVAPAYRGQKISTLLTEARRRHPLFWRAAGIGWPNEQSMGQLVRRGRAYLAVGPFTEGLFRLGRLPRAWGPGRRRRAGAAARGLRVEPITRFDAAHGELNRRCMTWPGYWCPHDGAFLDWRYRGDPTRECQALEIRQGDEAVGYCVLRVEERRGLLLEFIAPERGEAPRVLLEAALRAARKAGCRRVSFHATPAWPHWSTFRAAGVFATSGSRYVSVECPSDPGATSLEQWRLAPGDCDAT